MRQRAMQIGNAVPPLLATQLGNMFRPGAAAVDLFSGAGGLSLGLQLSGLDVVRAVDNNVDAVASYNENLGTHAVTADLSSDAERAALWSEIFGLAGGEIEVLAGGPPCQGFSTAGKALKDDPRNKLVWAFLDGVRVLQPRHVLMENVVALAQSRGRKYLDRLRHELHDLGYESRFAIFHVEAYGVPQLRRRVILLASRDRLPEWPEPIARTLNPAFRKMLPYSEENSADAGTVRDAIGDLPLEEAADLDAELSLGPAGSLLQEWLRGNRAVEQRLLEAA